MFAQMPDLFHSETLWAAWHLAFIFTTMGVGVIIGWVGKTARTRFTRRHMIGQIEKIHAAVHEVKRDTNAIRTHLARHNESPKGGGVLQEADPDPW